MLKFLKWTLIFFGIFLLLYLLVAFMSASTVDKSEYEEILQYTDSSIESDSTISVMTFNVGYLSGMTNNLSIKREPGFFDANLQKIVQLVQELAPDLVGLQEVDFDASRSFEVNQMDTIAIEGAFASGYKSVNWDKRYVPFPYWPPSNHFGRILSGQAILSRYPIRSGQTEVLASNESTPAYYRAFYIERLLQIAEVEYSGQTIIVMNVHLEAFDYETRVEQARTVKAAYESYASQFPVLLIGDFNSFVPELTEQEDAIELLMKAKWMASAVPFEKHKENYTYSSVEPVRMIDYILYNENFLTSTAARGLTEVGQVSDHLPLMAEFDFK